MALGILMASLAYGSAVGGDVAARNSTPVVKEAVAEEPPAGEGIYCAWALYGFASEVGSRCFPGQDQDFQANLRQSVARLETFVRQNSRVTEEEIATFRKDQARVGGPEALLCHGDGPAMYKGLLEQGGARISASVDKLVSRPGKPTWGDCL